MIDWWISEDISELSDRLIRELLKIEKCRDKMIGRWIRDNSINLVDQLFR
jgi:hypothetical protein